MRVMLCLSILFLGAALCAQNTVYVCPMDPDVRSTKPGVCPRCGMKMVAGIPDPIEYPMDLTVTPRAPKPGVATKLKFTVRDPWNNRTVTNFQIVHEKLFHMFVVSQDLQFFVHDHPEFQPEGDFTFDLTFPKPGMYRVLGDFYPDGAMPQLIAKTVFVPGPPPVPITLAHDYSEKATENMQVELTTTPAKPIAGLSTLMMFHIKPVEGLEPYLGAWCHMLAASDDLIDLIHTHPFTAEATSLIQFSVIFPRARTYRVWVQFQRKGVVNTARFDVPVTAIP